MIAERLSDYQLRRTEPLMTEESLDIMLLLDTPTLFTTPQQLWSRPLDLHKLSSS